MSTAFLASTPMPGFMASSATRMPWSSRSHAAEKNALWRVWASARAFYDQRPRLVRDLSCGDKRVYLEFAIRRVWCRRCGGVKREGLEWLADNPLYTKRFAFFVGRRCRETTVKDVAEELHLDWETVKELDKQYMREQLRRAGCPAPRVIGIDEIAIAKRHQYRIVVSDLETGPAHLVRRHRSLRGEPGRVLRLARPQEMRQNPPGGHGHVEGVPQLHPQGRERSAGRILYDKFHILKHLGRGHGQGPQAGVRTPLGEGSPIHQRAEISPPLPLGEPHHRREASLEAAVQGEQGRLNKAYLLKESFGQLWDYQRARLGSPVLRQLAGFPPVATPGALPEVCQDDRGSLGRHRGLLL